LAPGIYHAPFHDPITITIEDRGWQQEPAVGSDVVVLSRTSDPQERLTFYPGPTGNILDAAGLASLLQEAPGIQLSQTRTLSIGGAPAVEVDATATGSQPISLSVAEQNIELQPNRAYRITVAQAPMAQEGALHLIVAEAPKDESAQFLPFADRILKTLGFI
jgi:hypothetical protein